MGAWSWVGRRHPAFASFCAESCLCLKDSVGCMDSSLASVSWNCEGVTSWIHRSLADTVLVFGGHPFDSQPACPPVVCFMASRWPEPSGAWCVVPRRSPGQQRWTTKACLVCMSGGPCELVFITCCRQMLASWVQDENGGADGSHPHRGPYKLDKTVSGLSAQLCKRLLLNVTINIFQFSKQLRGVVEAELQNRNEIVSI